MQRYIAVRVAQLVITMLALSVLIFGLVRAAGDPAALMLDPSSTQRDYELIRADLGLDQPVVVQYWRFVSRAVQGDLGQSIRSKRPVREMIAEALPNTAKLAFASMVLGLAMAIPLGVLAAANKGTWIDSVARYVAGFGQSVPTFWVGLVLIHIFVIQLGWLPSSGMDTWQHYIMPSFTLGLFMMAGIVRLLRSSMLEVLDSEFVKLARLKGLSERRVIWRHALRNSLLSVLSFGGMYIAILLTGAILVETVFAWRGFGRMAQSAILNQDFPVIQGVVLTGGAIVVLMSLVVDLAYAWLDPRIRLEA
jgi:ABC-type dipeptide/oligopeptide/nickel transport system permease component